MPESFPLDAADDYELLIGRMRKREQSLFPAGQTTTDWNSILVFPVSGKVPYSRLIQSWFSVPVSGGGCELWALRPDFIQDGEE
jgi:hypothetical protein